jgi:hypothetical protein
MRFRHERIDDAPPAGRMTFCLTEDLTGDGRPDVLVGALGGQPTVTLPVLEKRLFLRELPVLGDLIDRLEVNVFWYENPGPGGDEWTRHEIGRAPNLSVGGALGDLTGDGRSDLVAGQNLASDLYWFERPDDPRRPWTRRLVTDEFHKYHDVAVADVDDDGEVEVVVLSQESETVFYYEVPEDPRQEPWPTADRHVVATGLDVEGVAVVDLDGDGRTELVAGPNVFRRTNDGWARESIAHGWEWTRVAVADLDGDGELEIVLSEGDRPYNGDVPGRVGVFDPPDWSVTVLRDDLSNPHTLQVADFDGDGRPELCVAEMGLGASHRPRVLVFEHDGDGYTGTCVAEGVPTHESKAVDLTGDGRPDLVGKSYAPTSHVDVWYNEPATWT